MFNRFDDPISAKLKQLPLSLSSNVARSVTPDNRLKAIEWRAIVSATEPIVQLSIVQQNDLITWVKGERNVGNLCNLRLRQDWDDASPNVTFVTYNNLRVNVLTGRTPAPVHIQAPMRFRTGQIIRTGSFGGESNVMVYSLFLVRADVTVARAGIWHLRRELRNDIPNPWRGILNSGRAGQLHADIAK
jgi:hypothetical protein